MVPPLAVLLLLQGSLILFNPRTGKLPSWFLPASGIGGLYVVVSLSPLVPALWLIWAQLRNLRRADEYQRVMQLEAMSIGFGVVLTLSLVGGLLDAAGLGSSMQSLQVTFIAGVLAWVCALAVKLRVR
jgi:hypothetical protein